ncbi:MAG: DUF4178 domain-containing protein [Elusimicrobiota bacterium]|nr:DUF4178 domain-containing protein [Elusimicrobiota bacterium]
MRKFDCPQCGGSLTLRAEGVTRTLACQYCAATLDVRDPRMALVGKYFSKLESPPTLPIGARGVLRGEELEIVGYQRKRVRYYGVDYDWGEYLLWNPYRGFRWLVESNGHWLLARTLPDEPVETGLPG